MIDRPGTDARGYDDRRAFRRDGRAELVAELTRLLTVGNSYVIRWTAISEYM